MFHAVWRFDPRPAEQDSEVEVPPPELPRRQRIPWGTKRVFKFKKHDRAYGAKCRDETRRQVSAPAAANHSFENPAWRDSILSLLFFSTLVTGPRRSLNLKLSGTRLYAPQIRARLGTTAHFCEVVVLKLT